MRELGAKWQKRAKITALEKKSSKELENETVAFQQDKYHGLGSKFPSLEHSMMSSMATKARQDKYIDVEHYYRQDTFMPKWL